jgi:pimeloyl-ACP methyl ester carboxylesterase
MPTQSRSGFVSINGAQLYYEIAGHGQAFVMIHAGVADSRQWNNEFTHFVQNYRVLRYDIRGYGQSEPVDGEFSNLGDLTALLDHLKFDEPLTLMGCSMGGGLAMDFALANPTRVKAIIMVGSGPSGLELDVPDSPKFAEAEAAYNAGDIDLLTELETQIWFDGDGRAPDQVNPTMRQLAYDMNHLALVHDAKGLGKRVPGTDKPAAPRLSELTCPVLIIVGEHDTPYILAAADYMLENIPAVQKVVIDDAAHLPNMDHPAQFQQIVSAFLQNLDA